MLSYRHAFHAGNHADILKHFVLHQSLQYLNQKDKPYWYIDTHAGAGVYALDQGYAAKNAEYESGIARLWPRDDLPPPLADFLTLVHRLNADGRMNLYPGAPWIANQNLRADDRLRLFELHPTDFKLLQENFQDAGRRAKIEQIDGFAGLKALLPPPPRRALVLIDPPYEEKQDYQRVPTALEDALKRFETGTYAVWYPILQRPELQTFIDKLKRLPTKSWLHVSLTVNTPSPDGFGMHGSGMFMLNPPWTLHATLQSAMPW
ncbi:MAG: 23S rRNA (adenine(2030)-N(6))-methyltransferase RlmJ, partial [Rhodoferax sp.]|nr:23S rRNA (adenine(2030)-N(6))-methyltransferase RlmJ [Rhodoferax sp.]